MSAASGFGPNPWQQTSWDWRAAGNFICGGAGIYMQALPYCDKLIITEVAGTYDADTSFPDFDSDDFDVFAIEEYPGFCVKTLLRKEKHV